MAGCSDEYRSALIFGVSDYYTKCDLTLYAQLCCAAIIINSFSDSFNFLIWLSFKGLTDFAIVSISL
ncbi:hypothetical protein A1D23_09245 [Chelonobacter oris]|nr:hypothetical protein [Chelonobacter oris]